MKEIADAFEKHVGEFKKKVGDFEHCGIMHKQLEDGPIVIHQNHYVNQLKPIPLTKEQSMDALCSPTDSGAYTSLLGGVAWVVNTRADIAIFVGTLQRLAKDPKYIDIKRLNIVLRILKRHPLKQHSRTSQDHCASSLSMTLHSSDRMRAHLHAEAP